MALIICTGAQARWLGIPSEEAFKGYGVSACATCDGFFYKGKEVVVVGGGNTAVEEAIFLTNFARRVTVVHRRDHFRAERIMQDRLFKNPKIEVIWDSAIEEVVGASEPRSVTGVKLKNVKTGAITERAADGVFIAIGHAPCNGALQGPARDEAVRAISSPSPIRRRPPSRVSSAAGDVKDDVFRQAVTAAGMGCMAALEAERFPRRRTRNRRRR